MKTIIYQYWDGISTPGNAAGVAAMKEYANRIGAEYLYEDNPRWQTNLGKYSPHYGAFKPLFTESFYDYDYLLFADTDVFPVADLNENIFEQFYNTDIELGICEEWQQPEVRKKHNLGGINNANDEFWVELIEKNWPVKMPRAENKAPRVYNSGVVVYSNGGMKKARKNFIDFKTYVKFINAHQLPPFYTCDQPYLHAMLEVCDFKWKTMDYKWNSSVHYVPGTKDPRPVNDLRNNSNFVHIQLRNADNYNTDQLYRITNLPVKEWDL